MWINEAVSWVRFCQSDIRSTASNSHVATTKPSLRMTFYEGFRTAFQTLNKNFRDNIGNTKFLIFGINMLQKTCVFLLLYYTLSQDECKTWGVMKLTLSHASLFTDGKGQKEQSSQFYRGKGKLPFSMRVFFVLIISFFTVSLAETNTI